MGRDSSARDLRSRTERIKKFRAVREKASARTERTFVDIKTHGDEAVQRRVSSNSSIVSHCASVHVHREVPASVLAHFSRLAFASSFCRLSVVARYLVLRGCATRRIVS